MSTRSEVFVREFVLGFGLIGGVYTSLGFDPEIALIKGLLDVLQLLVPSVGHLSPLVLFLIGAFLTVASIVGTYAMGGRLGLVSVGFAWMSGLIILRGPTEAIIGLILLLAAMVIGAVSARAQTISH